jgi:uncharacterized membrane protein
VLNFIALTTLFIAVIGSCVIPLAGFISTLGKAPSVVTFIYLCLSPLTIVGVYLSVRFKFYPFVILENEHMTLEALIRQSYKVTRGVFVPVFVALILMMLLNIAGALLFGVGLIVTVPVSLFATAHLYRKLVEHSA